MRIPAPWGAALLALPLLSGCTVSGLRLADVKLVDRTTFRATPPAPDAAAQARARLPPLPLATIQFDQPDIDWRAAVSDAVAAARARKPDASFDVLTTLPATAPADEQARLLASREADARDIANLLLYDGVSPDRVRLGTRTDPGAPPREVRVYVR